MIPRSSQEDLLHRLPESPKGRGEKDSDPQPQDTF